MSVRRRDLVFPQLSDASSDVRQLRSVGYELVGNWSLAQILEHLSKSLEMAIVRPDFKMNFLIRPIFKMMLLPMMRRGKPMGMTVKVPPTLAPSDNLDEAAAAEKFHAMIANLSDPNTEFQPFNPLMGKLTRDQWLVMQRWHCAHHLSYAVPKNRS